MYRVTFNNSGYDQFIDFLKGLCIVCVVLTHNIPATWQQVIGFPFWGGMAVPMFLIIQSYHYFKHNDLPSINWSKLWRRIILPFAVIQALFFIYIVIAFFCGSGRLTTPMREMVFSGGNGPGSYYFWIYLQFSFVLLPLFGWFQKKWKLHSWVWLLLFSVLSEGLELFCSFWHPNGRLYRLLAFRYLLLVYGGYVWAKNGLVCNAKTLLLSVISLVFVYLLQYRGMIYEPWIFDNDWKYFHWFCYFWVIYLLPVIAKGLCKISGGGIRKIFATIGKYSYQIFLVQMLVFEFFPYNMNRCIYICATTTISILPVIFYYKLGEFINHR